jgi:hypothetical protein
MHLTVADIRAAAVLLIDLGNRIVEREAADQRDYVALSSIRVRVPKPNFEARLVETLIYRRIDRADRTAAYPTRNERLSGF